MPPADSRARLRLDLTDERLWVGEQVIPLSRRPFSMLRYFVQHPNRLLTKEAILQHVWPDTWVTEGSIKDFVQVLRRALGDDSRKPRYIETVRGRGYRYLGGIEVLTTAPEPCFHASEHTYPPAVAVLPFCSPGREPRDEWLASGITEDIGTELSRFHSLCVVASRSCSVPAGRRMTTQSIGRQVGAHYLVSGSLRIVDDGVRITVRLLEAATGRILWAERYDQELINIFALQETIARGVASIVAERLRSWSQDRAARKLTEDLNAYDYVLRGQGIVADTKENNLRARQAFERAIELDPTCSRAYAGLAHSCVIGGIFQYEASFERSLDQALAFASHAVSLDNADSKAEWVLGHVLANRGEIEHALTHFDRALELNPIDGDAYVMKGMCLTDVGEPEKSFACYKAAMRLNPYYPGWYVWNLGEAYHAAKRYEQALVLLKTFTDRHPKFMRPRRALAATFARLGRIEAAEGVVGEILSHEPDISLEQEHALLLGRSSGQHLEHWLEGLRMAGFPE